MDGEVPITSTMEETSTSVQPKVHTDRPTILSSDKSNAEAQIDLPAIKKYLEYGFWCYGPNGKTTLLHAAAGYGSLEAVRYLVEQSFGPNITDDSQHAPLHSAVHHKHYETVEFLLENGASANIIGLLGDTPLHVAALNKDILMIDLLIKYGGDMYLRNEIGISPSETFPEYYNPLSFGTKLKKCQPAEYAVEATQEELGDKKDNIENMVQGDVKVSTGNDNTQCCSMGRMEEESLSGNRITPNNTNQKGKAKNKTGNNDIGIQDNNYVAIRQTLKRTYPSGKGKASKGKVRRKAINNEVGTKPNSVQAGKGHDLAISHNVNAMFQKENSTFGQSNAAGTKLGGTKDKACVSLKKRGKVKVETNFNARAPDDDIGIIALKWDKRKLYDVKDKCTTSLFNQHATMVTKVPESRSVNDDNDEIKLHHGSTSHVPNFELIETESEEIRQDIETTTDADYDESSSILPNFESLKINTELMGGDEETDENKKLKPNTQKRITKYLSGNKPPKRVMKRKKSKKS